MATKMIKHGNETYPSKAVMAKHEKSEPMKKKMQEEQMSKGKGLAIMIAIGKPKASPMPMRGQRTATNMMKKSSRGR
jgi:hypothetical protein